MRWSARHDDKSQARRIPETITLGIGPCGAVIEADGSVQRGALFRGCFDSVGREIGEDQGAVRPIEREVAREGPQSRGVAAQDRQARAAGHQPLQHVDARVDRARRRRDCGHHRPLNRGFNGSVSLLEPGAAAPRISMGGLPAGGRRIQRPEASD